ncbi:Transketolase 2 [Raoultella terrigena]|uniref:Transketolase 2 n=1 Tax=Raoultella terrigena TaxID=577 RepID=A0A3P8JZV3_RAOTE|nr:Transketolase 2 [Raoultella terrigena]
MNIAELKSHALAARRDIVSMIYESGIGHPGGALSIIDILTWLYYEEVDLSRSPRSRIVMSKGHAVAAQYAMLYQMGKIERREFSTFRQIDSRLQGHPSIKALPDVDATTGLLGQGLSVALGMAAAKKRRNDPHRVFAIPRRRRDARRANLGNPAAGRSYENGQPGRHRRLQPLLVTRSGQ